MWGCRFAYKRFSKTARGVLFPVVSGILISAGAALIGSAASAADQATGRIWINEAERGGQLVGMLNKSRTIRILRPFTTATIGAPDIADVLPMSDRSLYIQGKKIGTTNLSLFD